MNVWFSLKITISCLQNYRPRTTSFFSSSTEESNVATSNLSLHDSEQKKIKQRFTSFFGNTKVRKRFNLFIIPVFDYRVP